MSFNGSGSFSPYTPGNPTITGTTISSTAFNNTINDLASGLSNTMTRDGQSPATNNIPLGGFKLTGVAAATNAGDALAYGTAPSLGVVYTPAGAGAVATTVQAKLRESVSVLDFSLNTTPGTTDMTAAFQAAHDSLPSTGGTILVPNKLLYNFAVDGVYVNITKPNITILGDSGSWIVSPNSENAEVTTGTRYLNGFAVSGNNFVLSCNMRGPLVLWTAGAATDNLYCRNMIFKNLYNAAVSINTPAFDTLDMSGVTFDTSRDLASDSGNYSMVNRGGNGTMAKCVRVNNCTFIGVAGGIDAHDVELVQVGGGTRFIGVDINAIKITSYNGAAFEDLRLVVDESVTFDGTPVNAGSANRHLSATGLGRTAPGTLYMGFCQIFTSIRWHGKVKNAPNFGLAFLDGSLTTATINLDNSEWDTCPIAIQGVQGNISIKNARFNLANVVPNAVDNPVSLDFSDNYLYDSYVGITKKISFVSATFNTAKPINVQRNVCNYGVNNLSPIRYVNAGIDTGVPSVFVENNVVFIRGANTLAIDGATSGTQAILDGNKVFASGGATTNGVYKKSYKVIAGTLFLPVYDGSITITNEGAVGNISVSLPADSLWPVGTSFRVAVRNAFSIILNVSNNSAGTINGNATSATFTTQYGGGIVTKVAASTWIISPFSGTLTLP